MIGDARKAQEKQPVAREQAKMGKGIPVMDFAESFLAKTV
jgi:hypothetical protein